MPKNTVSDSITDQEMAFAHLILSETMNDRRAAKAVGLNPEIAAYTKAKPRVRAYMTEHRAAVKEEPVDRDAQGLPKLNIGRDQILTRLWELAVLSHEVTRGSIAGQIKALSMIAAIEGLIPDRRLSPRQASPAIPPVSANIYKSEWLRKQQHQAAGEEQADPVAATEAQSTPPPVPEPESASHLAEPTPHPDQKPDRNQASLSTPLLPQGSNWAPQATGSGFDALRHAAGSLSQPFSIQKGRFGRRR